MTRVFVALAALVGASAAQPGFRIGVDIVTVTATVTDNAGRFVAGLRQEDFTIAEDGRRCDLVFFAGDSAPVSLGILLDASGSMTRGKLDLARQSVSRLVTHDLDGSSEWFFARFGYSVVVAQEWTSDRDAIVQPLREVRATGDTALYDTLALAIPLANEGHFQKKALLLVSDGGESKSLLSLDDVRKAIGQNDVRVFAIGVDATDGPRSERLNMQTLRQVADDTGGRTYIVARSGDIPAVTAQIADELQHQYLLGYSTRAGRDGRRHAINVDVRGAGRTVRARRGFVAD